MQPRGIATLSLAMLLPLAGACFVQGADSSAKAPACGAAGHTCTGNPDSVQGAEAADAGTPPGMGAWPDQDSGEGDAVGHEPVDDVAGESDPGTGSSSTDADVSRTVSSRWVKDSSNLDLDSGSRL